MVHGRDPLNEIDHKNQHRCDNRLLNLREATHSENNHNVGVKAHSASGIKGVDFVRSVGKWRAQIRRNNRSYHLGYFYTSDDARAAYAAAAKSLYGAMARTA